MSDWYSMFSVGATIAAGLITKGQGFLLYIPDEPSDSKTNIDTPLRYGISNSSLVQLETADKTLIYAYFLAQPTIDLNIASTSTKIELYSLNASNNSADSKSTPEHRTNTLIYFHGNAGNFGHRLPLATNFYSRFKLNVILVSYRGYGKSQGTPSETGLKEDAQATLDFVLNHSQLKLGKVILFGQSMGGAVAIDLAFRNKDKIDALVVENTFLSIPKLVNTLVPQVSYFTPYICTQPWDSQTKIKTLPHIPTLFLSGDSDTLIDKSHMEQLFLDSAGTEQTNATLNKAPQLKSMGTKTFVSITGGCHNDTSSKPSYLDAISNFLIRNKFL